MRSDAPTFDKQKYLFEGLDELKKVGLFCFKNDQIGMTYEHKQFFGLLMQQFLSVVQSDIRFMELVTLNIEVTCQECMSMQSLFQHGYVGIVAVTMRLNASKINAL